MSAPEPRKRSETILGLPSTRARGATLRRQIVGVPARIARPQRRRVLHLPEHWPWARDWLKVWRGVFGEGLAPPVTT